MYKDHGTRAAEDRPRLEFDMPQNQVRQERRPYLSLNRLFVFSEEVLELKRLLEFLEQNLHSPSRLVESSNGRRRPLEIIVEEKKIVPIAVHLDMSRDLPQCGRI